jgi:hypothetical protein
MEDEKDKMTQFKNGVSWAGENFSYAPGDVISLKESIARAREEAGLGTCIK